MTTSCISGHIDHAARVMQVITWNKSFRGVPNSEGMKENSDADDYETHATVLDKLLAWEKKLYEEIKVHFLSTPPPPLKKDLSELRVN